MTLLDFPDSTDPIARMKGAASLGTTVIIEGRAIPKLTMVEVGDGISLTLDNRFNVVVPRNLAYQVAWIIGQSLAIGSGYPSLSAPTKEQPFAPEVFFIDGGLL